MKCNSHGVPSGGTMRPNPFLSLNTLVFRALSEMDKCISELSEEEKKKKLHLPKDSCVTVRLCSGSLFAIEKLTGKIDVFPQRGQVQSEANSMLDRLASPWSPPPGPSGKFALWSAAPSP